MNRIVILESMLGKIGGPNKNHIGTRPVQCLAKCDRLADARVVIPLDPHVSLFQKEKITSPRRHRFLDGLHASAELGN